MMRRLFPAPLLSAALVVLWLLLNESWSVGHVLLALLLGLLLPVLFASLRPQQPRIRRPLRVLRLVLLVGRDVLRSNLEVGTGVLRLQQRVPNSAFVTIPLELRDPTGLAALAMITTVVPGTVWCELARDASAVRLHVWDVQDEAAFIAHYKSAYEAPLLEIYQ
ncbi:Na+/H+ antiporter subunit E [Brachymonas denitrificans]|jgi:multicomponent K+:H+ antiporter subunit E|uniref:Multisubunit potassium/proton antiporter, PhaE subunit (TC 2.A.63.1.1) n=1 Tax=Brachymonas denitrificans DSM 15123 TaxID=1121117 RepID=A0A1H8D844_9BURK|nr:Na+/H+ antiporter subunit E [Brachymonas denitrificans]SEN02984.1 multisubunit potassium/proton antiporter, PhaE subunit (TC 2.A.63.1.1) [Brachymonas denitrificans DSM 15123]